MSSKITEYKYNTYNTDTEIFATLQANRCNDIIFWKFQPKVVSIKTKLLWVSWKDDFILRVESVEDICRLFSQQHRNFRGQNESREQNSRKLKW